jgi:hypothetical protein
MNAIISAILANQGTFRQSAGLVFGVFDQPDRALLAMQQIVSWGFAAARWGNRITVEI